MERVDVLAKESKHLLLDVYETIDMGSQMRNIIYAIDNVLQIKFNDRLYQYFTKK